MKAVLMALRATVEAHWRAYAEPPLASANATAPPPTMAADAESPLPPGVLTNNLGLGIVIVCTKVRRMLRNSSQART